MKLLRSWEISPDVLGQLLQRPPLEDMPVSEHAMERTAALFGRRLTPLEAVGLILEEVRRRGDEAVLELARRIDGADLTEDGLYATEAEMDQAVRELDSELRDAIDQAIENVRWYHEHQRRHSWFTTTPEGAVLGQRILPLKRVGAYVPGGSAPLLSSGIMCVVPAKVAGVPDVIVATPAGADGRVNPGLLATLRLAGADRVLKIGGAQAIAALAFGTPSIPAVDKIVGPGNTFVQLAKKLVFGRVGIDSLAGPSEVLILADRTANPEYIAADMLAQAEHAPEAAAILLTTDEALAHLVIAALERRVAALPRGAVAVAALERWGRAVVFPALDEAIVWVNRWAAEHVEVMTQDPWGVLPKIHNAGAVFLGAISAEVIGDYVAGPNHILPTNGTARFSSPLSVDDFVKRSSLIAYTEAAMERNGVHAIRLAEVEGLDGHAESLHVRLANGRPTG